MGSIRWFVKVKWARALLVGCFGLLVSLTAPEARAQANSAGKPAARRVTLDFHAAPMVDVVQYFSTLLGENYIIAGDLDASHPLTVYATRPVSIVEARRVFETALIANGLTMVRAGAFWKITKFADAHGGRLEAGPGRRGEATTRLVELGSASAVELAPLLEKVGGPGVRIVTWSQRNALIVVATDGSFARLMEVIEALDRPGERGGIHVVELEHADAEDVAGVLRGIAE